MLRATRGNLDEPQAPNMPGLALSFFAHNRPRLVLFRSPWQAAVCAAEQLRVIGPGGRRRPCLSTASLLPTRHEPPGLGGQRLPNTGHRCKLPS